MPRYRLTIAYDGTAFCGWQKQEPPAAERPMDSAGRAARAYSARTPLMDTAREGRVALRTVQGVVEAAVRHVVRQPVEVLGASRTDSGVHARGQVAAFTCGGDEPAVQEGDETATEGGGWPLARGADRLVAAINARLPEDVLVLRAEATEAGFDPVGHALRKAYTYTFHVARDRPLWDRHYVHHVWAPSGLDAQAMREAARTLVGEHDFAAFAAAGHGRLSTVRTVFACGVEEVPPGGCRGGAARRIVVRIEGSGFLWNMVRIIAGTLMQVGLGQRSAAEIRAVLAGRDRGRAGPTLGPEGLCLEWVHYGPGELPGASG
ncbi:MAG: tRNA pseudouridine synthase A [Phycisphaerae bacterium]|nr:tRNA pseudouridine synthase A [Phycisphaerae bacterium]